MNIDSGILLNDSNMVVLYSHSALILRPQDNIPYIMGNRDLRPIRFLSGSPDGRYFAYWSDYDYGFYAVDIAGEYLWSTWINGDKALPHGIHYSNVDTAFACIFDFEFARGLFLCDPDKGYATRFGCAGSPIGYDAGLKYFVIDGYDPGEEITMTFFERDENGNSVRVPLEDVKAKFKQHVMLTDRYRHIIPQPVIPVDSWDGMALQSDLSGFVILKEGNLYWYNNHSDTPETTINGCFPPEKRMEWFRKTMTLCGENVLIQTPQGSAIVANKQYGVIWRGNEGQVASVQLCDQWILVEYENGDVQVIQGDGYTAYKYERVPVLGTLAANIKDNVLSIATMSRDMDLEIRTQKLANEPDRVNELIKRLRDETPEVRKKAVEELGEIKDGRAVEPLTKALYDEVVDVCRSAVVALGKIGDINAIHYLASTYLGPDRDQTKIIRFIDSRKNSEKDNQFIVDAILQIGPAAIDTLADIVEKQGGPEYYDSAFDKIRWQVALLALWEMPDDRAQEVVEHLIKHEDYFVRALFANFLGEREEDRATDLLIRAFEDKHSYSRNKVVAALGYKRGAAVKSILDRALNDEDAKVRETAADSLKKWKSFYHNVRYVHFGEIWSEKDRYGTTLKNPDMAGLNVPLDNLSEVIINTRSFDTGLLEKFLDYAVRYIGEQYLKEHVYVCYFFSTPRNLDPQLRNRLRTIFKQELRIY